MTVSDARSRPTTLTIVPYYLPGYRAGGPIRSVSTLVQRLSDEFAFRIVTGDRDAGDGNQYEDIEVGAWNGVGNAQVYYLPPSEQSLGGLTDVLGSASHDLLYLNAFFHPVFSFRVLALRRLGRLSDVPLLLAPRGHLSPGALAVKPWRKRAYLALTKLFGFCEDVAFHACSAMEEEEIHRIFPGADVRVAPNLLPAFPTDDESEPAGRASAPKEPGRLRAVFLSRIAPKKNLLAALRALRDLDASVSLSIVGPIDDETYWDRCRDCIDGLPPNVEVNYVGSVEPSRVPGVLASHHLFVLPTRSENFGHAILEALSVGVPVLISDQTPWSDVQEFGAGWSCPVESEACLSHRLREAAELGSKELERMSDAAQRYIDEVASQEAAVNSNREMFRRLARKGKV